MGRDVIELTPELQIKHELFKRKMTSAGLSYILTRTGCTFREQVALFAQGRQSVNEINVLRAIAFMNPIDEDEAKRVVTWTLLSKHITDIGLLTLSKSRAFDIALTKDHKTHWNIKISVNDNSIPDYKEAGVIGESCGLTWGGRFSKPDYCHFELNHKD